jgi:fused signal recognition particle receptor
MFGFLKDKLKSIVAKFTKKVETEAKEEVIEVEKPKVKEEKKVKVEKKVEKPVKKPAKVEAKKPEVKAEKPRVEEKKAVDKKPEVPKVEVAKPKIEPEKPKVEAPKVEEKKGFFAKIKEAVVGPEALKVEVKKPEVVVPEAKPVPEETPTEKKGFFARIGEAITTKKISEKQFDEMFWDLELALLENNAAVEVIEKIKTDLKGELVDKPIPRTKVEETIVSSLRKSIIDLFPVEPPDLLKMVKQKKPFVICFVGVNGSGKTTSIAKVAHLLKQNGLSVVMAAADTFRAAAIDQLQVHADKLNVKLIRHDYGSDPAAVAFDAIKHAEAAKKDVVLIDTAGRLHSNTNLMDEMKKIMRVAKPDLKIFVGESITGNDCTEQAKQFDSAIGIDCIILAKADVDEKGGAAISVSYVTKKPILYLGVGQEYPDLQQFDKEKLIASIGL